MKRKAHIILLVLLLLCVLSTTAFAIDESEVESAIAASSKEEVAGNVFIWFLCAIGFCIRRRPAAAGAEQNGRGAV